MIYKPTDEEERATDKFHEDRAKIAATLEAMKSAAKSSAPVKSMLSDPSSPPASGEVGKRLEEIRKRADAATKGSWTYSPQEGKPSHAPRSQSGCFIAQVWGPDDHSLAEIEPTDDPAQSTANAAFVANSRDDIPFLLTLIEQLMEKHSGD